MRHALIAVIVTCLIVLPSAPAQAQNETSNDGSFLGLWNVDSMMNTAVKNIARRYNLNEQQEKYTQALMTRGVKEFLGKHEDDLRELLTEMIAKQVSKEEVTAEMAKRWGDMAMPMFHDAKKSILENNMAWREILNEDQKKIHDLDLRLMQGNFKQFEERFQRWQDGEHRPGEMPIGPARPADATAAQPTTPPQIVRQMKPDTWELYVQQFSDKYKLDKSQRTSASAILVDCRNRANQYLEANKTAMAGVDAELADARKTRPIDREALMDVTRRNRELSAPVTQLYNEMKERLDKIPTEAQRRAVGEAPSRAVTTTQPAASDADDATKPQSTGDADDAPKEDSAGDEQED